MRSNFNKMIRAAIIIWSIFFIPLLLADGSSIGKIYTPYVEQLGTEIEVEYLHQKYREDADPRSYRFGVGRPITDKMFAELSILAENNGSKSGGNNNLEIEGYEAEIKWQLTEQGEYSADYAVMVELERESDLDVWELSSALLVSRDFGRVTSTANLALLYESANNRQSEWETSLAFQARYRWRSGFEPALEYFKSENTNALGPVISGLMRMGIRKKLRWELGVLWDLDNSPVDKTLKVRLEFEF